MAILSTEIVKFAAGDTDFYECAVDNYLNPTAEKKAIIQNAFFSEIERKSGVSRQGLTPEAWMTHPSVRWVR